MDRLNLTAPISPSIRSKRDNAELAKKSVGQSGRINSCENLLRKKLDESSFRKSRSYESLDSNAIHRCFKHAKLVELNNNIEENEITDIINDLVLVNAAPTLVTVLIKPEDNSENRETKIEEIGSNAEVPIDTKHEEKLNYPEALANPVKRLPDSIDHEERSNSDDIAKVPSESRGSYENVRKSAGPPSARSSSTVRPKPKFRKQDSIDVITLPKSTSLRASQKFGSVEDFGIQRDYHPLPLERSQTNLEKRPLASSRGKKLNNIKEIDDSRSSNKQFTAIYAGKHDAIWKALRGSSNKNGFERKDSNESDKVISSSSNLATAKGRNFARTSLDELKRKTSKDSSSSSSKEEQIAISNLVHNKSLQRRKSSTDQEINSPSRFHTPIQRGNRRTEIIAAVTQRLYTNKKHSEDSSSTTTTTTPLSNVRSPPESNADFKLSLAASAARMKLQEISRKMLAKRRRVSVDTQTENLQTMRVKDIATITEVVSQDASVWTDKDFTEMWEDRSERYSLPTRRVKEIAVSTDKPKIPIIRRRDMASLTNDFNEYGFDAYSPCTDSGVLSDDAYSCGEICSRVKSEDLASPRKIASTESSTNTILTSSLHSFGVQTQLRDPDGNEYLAFCNKPCCTAIARECRRCGNKAAQPSDENSIVSISLNDIISLTIDGSSILQSNISFVDDDSESVEELRETRYLRDNAAQTDEREISSREPENTCYWTNFINNKPSKAQIDHKLLKFENIIQKQMSSAAICSEAESCVWNFAPNAKTEKSITFTKSLGTLFIPDTRDIATEVCSEKPNDDGLSFKLFNGRKIDAEDGDEGKEITRSSNSLEYSPETVIYNDFWKNWTIVKARRKVRNNEIGTDELGIDNAPIYNNKTKRINYDAPALVGQKFHYNLESKNTLDAEYNFSDDSLDCCDVRINDTGHVTSMKESQTSINDLKYSSLRYRVPKIHDVNGSAYCNDLDSFKCSSDFFSKSKSTRDEPYFYNENSVNVNSKIFIKKEQSNAASLGLNNTERQESQNTLSDTTLENKNMRCKKIIVEAKSKTSDKDSISTDSLNDDIQTYIDDIVSYICNVKRGEGKISIADKFALDVKEERFVEKCHLPKVSGEEEDYPSKDFRKTDDIIIPIESYLHCLKAIRNLENRIDQINCKYSKCNCKKYKTYNEPSNAKFGSYYPWRKEESLMARKTGITLTRDAKVFQVSNIELPIDRMSYLKNRQSCEHRTKQFLQCRNEYLDNGHNCNSPRQIHNVKCFNFNRFTRRANNINFLRNRREYHLMRENLKLKANLNFIKNGVKTIDFTARHIPCRCNLLDICTFSNDNRCSFTRINNPDIHRRHSSCCHINLIHDNSYGKRFFSDFNNIRDIDSTRTDYFESDACVRDRMTRCSDSRTTFFKLLFERRKIVKNSRSTNASI
ncbi:uncharacterized protein [Prorops nasuta]|uniref:uncharacterized protein isoform X2 n=1 Tax=Prorops nasuta TaxID=863751 RepID=UPI0034D01FEF